ncbi:hypothetical protein QUF80_09730 [Desulfococcaceae bacterium HSG8]|nr:hypothetical protein [Desulfococcaceae bacterium HSG8]
MDTDRIKDYVFATGTLKEIRGAILDELNRKQTKKIVQDADPSAKYIYANGGSAMFEVDEAKAADCIRAVRKHYSDRTITGAVSLLVKFSKSSIIVQILTILFTDMVGSTAIKSELGIQKAQTPDLEHKRLLKKYRQYMETLPIW